MSDDPSINPNNASEAAAGTLAQQTLGEYLTALKAIHASGAGVPETSSYPALSNLFNAVGKTIKPKVRCIINLGNQGQGDCTTQ